MTARQNLGMQLAGVDDQQRAAGAALDAFGKLGWTLSGQARPEGLAGALPARSTTRMLEHMFDILRWPPPPVTVPPEEVIDCLVEDRPGVVEPVRWSEYLPDGLLADLLTGPADADAEHREFEALERVGAWEWVIAWAQARQAREMTWFMDGATVRHRDLGACDSQAHDSAVAEVGLMLITSARTAACRVGEAWSLCTRLPATLAALEASQITLAKARVVDAETLTLSDEHTAAVEQQALAKARQQTPGQLRAATRRERGVRIWPEPDGMATLCAYLPAADAVGVFAMLDEYARHAGAPVTSAASTPVAPTPWSTWCSTQSVSTARPPAPPTNPPSTPMPSKRS
jgi:hypothetical protein